MNKAWRYSVIVNLKQKAGNENFKAFDLALLRIEPLPTASIADDALSTNQLIGVKLQYQNTIFCTVQLHIKHFFFSLAAFP